MFTPGPAQSIVVVVERTGLAASSRTADVRDDIARKKYVRRVERRSIAGRKRGARLITDGVGTPNGRPAIVPLFPSPEPELVQDGWRQRGDQRSRKNTWLAQHPAVVPAGPVRNAGLVVLCPISLPASAKE